MRLLDRRRQQRAVALLLALGVLFVLSVLAISFVKLQSVERQAASSYANRVRAKLASEAGIRRALAVISQHTVGGTINDQTADWRYYGEDKNKNGIADAGEDTNGDGKVEFQGCPVEWATAPSMQVTGTDYSGALPKGSESQADRIVYTLKVLDASAYLDLNWGTAADLGKMLDNLGKAIDPLDPPIVAGEGAKIVAYRESLATKKFLTLDDLREATDTGGTKFISADDYDRVKTFLTVDAWRDTTVLHPKKSDHTNNDPDTYTDDIDEAWLVTRAPVNINFAPYEVLVSLFTGITATYVEDFDNVLYPNVPSNPNQNNATDPATSTAYDSQSVIISFDEAKELADAIILRRKPANGGSFTDWAQFLSWMSGTSVRPSVFTGSEALTFLKCDVVLANLNPNTDTQRFNPNRTWASLNRKNAAGEYVFRGADKWDLLTAASDPGWTTEGSLLPTGNFLISSLGRVVDRFGNVAGEYKVATTARAYDIFRLHSQYDFEGDTGTTTHRTDVVLTGRAVKTRIDSYPEFDPQSWALTGVPQKIVAPDGTSTSISTKPAIYDGQLAIAAKATGAGGSYFYLSFRPDKNGTDDDLSLDYGSIVGYFNGDKIIQRSVMAKETRDLVAGTRNSGLDITIPRFEWNSNVLPDGVMFVTRRHLAYGGGDLSGRFSVQFWGKMIYQTDNDRIDDLVVSPKSSSDPLYGPGFDLNSKGSHEPTLFVDFTMQSYTGIATILSFWINYDTPTNNAQFIVQRSGGAYEWHSAFHAPALDRGVWYHFGLLATEYGNQLVVNDTVNTGATGSYFDIDYIYSSNWGHFYPVHKCAMAYATMDEIRIWPTLRDSADVVSDYLDGRYHGSGTWESPKISFPGGETVTFINANWTEHLPDGITSDIELTFKVYSGATLVKTSTFTAPSLSNNILAKGDSLEIEATLTASSSGPLLDTPILDDISVVFQRGNGAEILKWETF